MTSRAISQVSSSDPVVKAKGNWLHTSTGAEIFDATGGAAVSCLGHGHPRIKAAITAQLDEIEYCFGPFFTHDVGERLATWLTASTGGKMSKAYITSSGTEAIEAALKLARQYFTELSPPQPQRKRFIGRLQSYHGNTLGSLEMGSRRAAKTIYEPMLSGNVSHVSPCYPYRGKKNDKADAAYVARLADELEGEFQRVGSDTVSAFVMETMAGLTLGAVQPLPGYLQAMKAVCDRHGALFILDEVLCGMGRTGDLHLWQAEGVIPHIQTIAKGLGSGYQPIGAMLVHRSVVEVFTKGSQAFVHNQTYQGHPVACAAAYEVQQVIAEDRLIENVRRLGPYFGEGLQRRLGSHKHVGDIRGRGFLRGIEIVQDKETKLPFPVTERIAAKLHATGFQPEFGISLLPSAGVADGKEEDLVMLAPAYNVTAADIDLIVERTARVIEHVLGCEKPRARL